MTHSAGWIGRSPAITRVNNAEAEPGLLEDYHLYHASHAELLRELGHPGQARAAYRRALELTANPRQSEPYSSNARPCGSSPGF